jgi:hypothetical protein
MNIFVLALLVYLLYRFIAGFLIPLFGATRHVRQQFQDMTGNPQGPADKTRPGSAASTQSDPSSSGSSKVGEYIDFEEIK